MPMNEGRDNEEWTLIIQPKGRWLRINFRELYQYRDLIRLFINRDFVTVYKQTILGPLWFIINPLFTTIVYSFIFGNLAKIPTDGVPQTLFYYAGTMLWGYFSACLNSAADTFTSNSVIFSKVYFPRLVAPISKIFSNLISVGIQFATLVFFYAYFLVIGTHIRPTWALVFLPLIFAQLAMLSLGFGMIVSSLTTRYRDLRQLVNFGISLWMYATPIVYPLSQIPARFRWIILANPLDVPIEGFRVALFGAGNISLTAAVVSTSSTVAIFIIGLLLFSKSEQTFIDVV